MPPLTAATLASITEVPVPTYDRAAASIGIVHIGFGNFHRSHEAMYVDRLMEQGQAMDWGICGVGILPGDAAMRDVMADQDCLYTLVLRHPDGRLEPRVIGSVLDYRYGPDDPEAVLQAMSDPAVRIVSLTVTEGGYLKNAASGAFDPDHPDVLHDVSHPTSPRTAFAYVVEALRRRRAAGISPFTVLSCDNLQGNGHVAQQAILGFAALSDPEFAQWIEENVAFPNSMVDRITPATTDGDREAVLREFGVEDQWPVTGEPFAQWIIEDRFPAGRPPFERVGAQIVPDVAPYELMKLRLLNASHQAIAYFGAALGYVLVDEALRDELIRDYLVEYMRNEAIPTLAPVPGIDLDEYVNTLIERFSNPHMRDTLVRLATDGSNRMATFTLPAIRDNLIAGRSIRLGAAMVAAWADYWSSIASGLLPADQIPADMHADTMTRMAAAQDGNPTAFIELRELFGGLAWDARFREAFLAERDALRDHGTRGMLARLLGRDAV